MPLSKRIYFCEGCGTMKDRDINASINILNRATVGHTGSYVRGDNVRPQKEAVVEELKTYPANAVHVNAREAHNI